MNKKVLLCSLLLSLPLAVSAAETIPLWPNGAPNKSSITEPETTNDKGAIFNVTNGRLEVNVPKNPNGRAIILIPGGDMEILPWELSTKVLFLTSWIKDLQPSF